MGALKSKFRRSKSRSDKTNDASVKSPKRLSKKKSVNLPESQSARKTVDPRLPFSNYRQIFSIRNAWKAIQRAMEECAKETFVSFLTKNAKYRAVFTDVKGLKDEDLETLRFHEDFELKAMNMYNIFDDVITNLEEVNKALRTIEYEAEPTEFTAKMLKAYHNPFIETIKWHLGSDRFTEATENNFELLYQFVYDEMLKYVRDDTAEPDEVEEEATTVENDAVEPDIPNIDADVHAEADAADPGNENVADNENEAENENEVDNENETNNVGNDSVVVEDSQIEVSLCADEKS